MGDNRQTVDRTLVPISTSEASRSRSVSRELVAAGDRVIVNDRPYTVARVGRHGLDLVGPRGGNAILVESVNAVGVLTLIGGSRGAGRCAVESVHSLAVVSRAVRS